MRSIFFQICMGITITCSPQALPDIEWQKSYGGISGDQGKNVITSGDSYILASLSTGAGGDIECGSSDDYRVWLTRLTSDGNLSWQGCFGQALNGTARVVLAPSNDGFVMGTTTVMNAPGVECDLEEQNIWIVKFDASGGIQWQKCFGGSGVDAISNMQSTSDGGYILAGSTTSIDGDVLNNHGQTDIWVVKLTPSGDVEWANCYGGSSNESGTYVIETLDGGFLISGYTTSDDHMFAGINDVSILTYAGTLIKVSTIGDVEWIQCYGGSGHDHLFSLVQEPDIGYWAMGTTRSANGDISNSHGDYDGWLLKVDLEGDLIENRCYGGSDIDGFKSLIRLNNGQLAVIGETSSSDGDVTVNHGQSDAWLLRVGPDLEILDERSHGGSSHDVGNDLTLSGDVLVFCGTSNSIDGDLTSNQGLTDSWVVKLEPWDDTSVETINMSSSFSVYPNPASDLIDLNFAANDVTSINVEIFDPCGRNVITTMLRQGDRSISVEALAAGMYHVRINAGDRSLHSHFIKQ